MSDTDDSIPFLDLENAPDVGDVEEIETKFKGIEKPSTSQLANLIEAKSDPELEGLGEDVLLIKLINGELTYAQYAARMGRNDEDIDVDDEESAKFASVEFDKELTQSRRDNLRGNLQGQGDGRNRRKKRTLPPALQGLMGQANLCYARGESDIAEKLCLEIIRQEPLAPEPFISLAHIYEYTDQEKFLQFSLIAAYLSPGDVNQWVKLADMLIEQGNVKRAITCLTRAINADPSLLELRMRRIELLDMIGEEKTAFRCRFTMIPHVPVEQGDFLIQLAKKVAEKCHSEGNVTKALHALESAYEKVPNLFKFEDLNLLLELLLETGEYKKVVEILKQHTGLTVQPSDTDCNTWRVDALQIPDNMLLDFRTKLIVALIHLKCFHLLNYLFANVFDFISLEEAGDCYLDIAEALMKEEQYQSALQLLDPLVKSENFSLAAIWMRHADCHRALGNIVDAITSYRKVIELSQHLDAKLTLAALLKQKGEFDDALVALYQDPETLVVDPGVLYERCLLLKEMKRYEEYLEEGFLLLSRHCVMLRNRSEMTCMLLERITERPRTVMQLREQSGEPVDDIGVPEFGVSDMEPTLEKEYALFLDLMKTACEIRRFDQIQRIVFTMLSGKRFRSFGKELEFFAMLGSFYNRDFEFAFSFLRPILIRHPSNHKLWNMCNQMTQFSEDLRYNRFLFRTLKRAGVPLLTTLMQGNYFLMAGTYKYAMNEYVSLYKSVRDPILPLLLAITLIQIATQKYSARKQTLITQAIGYMDEYRKLREPEAEQEIYYNYGRIFHQVGLLSLALDNYKRALAVDNELIQRYPNHLDLKPEIAYNIHLIYKHSGNYDLAKKYLFDYIVV